MQLTIIKKNKLMNVTLPEKVEGNHWITDFENGRQINLINIESVNGEWQIISNQDAFIVDDKDVMIPHPILKDYGFYILKNNYRNEKYYLYCSPNEDKTFKELGISGENVKVKVGSDKSCDISYQLNTIPKIAFIIEKQGNFYYINIQDKQAHVYLNQKRVLTPKRIEYGDIIFTFGLKVILMRRDGKDYLLINSPNNYMNFSAAFSNVIQEKDDFIDDDAELSDDSLYKDSNYFYRTPHFYNELEPLSMEIDAPPTKKEKDETPVLLTVGPMLTMSMTSVVMLISSLSNMRNGNGVGSQMTSIVMAGAMLASCLLWPMMTRAYQNFSEKKYEHKRQKKYKSYIEKKEVEIEKHIEKQKNNLLENNLSVADTQNVIRGHNVRLWQRRITDSDFLTLPVGIGNTKTKIDIKYPEEHFSMSDDDMLELALELGKKERILQDVPITFSFYDNISTGIIGDAIITKEFIDRIVLQIMANYSYDEVKIVTFTSMENETDWDYIKILPHSWSNDKAMRFFGSSNDDYREMIYVLEKIYNERKENDSSIKQVPHYIIITDAIKSIDNYDFIKEVMSNSKNLGFSVIMMVDKLSALPNECKNFINVNRDECGIFSSAVNLSAQRFKIDFTPIDDIYNCARELANIDVNIKSEIESSLPDIYQFMEMYQVGKVEQLNALDRWKKSNPILSLRAPIGIGKSGELITLDLHEKYHGPHGLIAGTTGSGKSEFIITYILSLAVNYHPYEVQMILIDYKGGSLAGAFTSSNYRLPHLAGTITNLDGNELNRSLASIESEVKRRQALFNEARKVSNESTIDIYKYQKLYRENKLKNMEPVSHLLIISDEFAELKEQQPEFMDKLISIARVGRSLGIHLILATQKPGGVVDSQIWSNTRFRVSLKVQDTSDSQEVLKKPDAAYLKKTGRFYLQVGYDEVYTLGQSAWAGGQYYPSTTFKKEIDKSVNIINNIGYITTTREPNVVVKEEAQGEELPAIVKYLSDLANKENIKIRKLWLDKIPEKIFIDDLKTKYKFQRKPYFIEPIIGEYDDPSTQNQYVLTIPFSRIGNTIVYGIAGSGKEMFLEALIYSSMISYAPEEVNFYIMDFGAETLRVFNDSPYVGDYLTINEPEKINNLFKMINEEIEMRKRTFSSYGGSYQSFIESSGKSLPNYIVIINNYEAFYENYEDITDELGQILRDANKYGIFFIVTATNDSALRMRMKQNFALNYVLQQNNDDDYSSILGNARGKAPAKLKGRGLFKKDSIYEFQTAMIKEDNLVKYIKLLCQKYKESTNYRAKKIPVLPEVVNFEAVKDSVTKSTDMVIGINQKTLIPEKFNFKKNSINCISSYELSNMYTFINALVDEIAYTKEYELLFINTSEQEFINSNLQGRIATRDFDNIFNKFADFIEGVYDSYQSNGFNEDIINRQNKYMIIVYGVNDFINKLSEENKRRFADIINKDNQMGLVSFVLVDSPDIIKTYSYEEWFRSGVDLSRGIWIGSGIFDQTLFKISKLEREDREDIPIDFGFIIHGSKASRIKLLDNFKDEQN